MMKCDGCKHCVWDGKAPFVYCGVEGAYRTPCTEDCKGFEEHEERDDTPEDESYVVIHELNISGIVASGESRVALDVVSAILDESPTLRHVLKRMAVRKIVVPSGKSEDVSV